MSYTHEDPEYNSESENELLPEDEEIEGSDLGCPCLACTLDELDEDDGFLDDDLPEDDFDDWRDGIAAD